MGIQPTATKPLTAKQRLSIIKEITNIFRFERYAYLSISLISFVFLLVISAIFMKTHEMNWPELVGLFGPSGLITLGCTRVLVMWQKAVDLVFKL